VRLRQAGLHELGQRQVGAGEVDAREVGARQVDPAQPRLGQAEALEPQPAARALLEDRADVGRVRTLLLELGVEDAEAVLHARTEVAALAGVLAVLPRVTADERRHQIPSSWMTSETSRNVGPSGCCA